MDNFFMNSKGELLRLNQQTWQFSSLGLAIDKETEGTLKTLVTPMEYAFVKKMQTFQGLIGKLPCLMVGRIKPNGEEMICLLRQSQISDADHVEKLKQIAKEDGATITWEHDHVKFEFCWQIEQMTVTEVKTLLEKIGNREVSW